MRRMGGFGGMGGRVSGSSALFLKSFLIQVHSGELMNNEIFNTVNFRK